MVYSLLKTECYRRLGISTTTPDTDTVARIGAFINAAHKEILRDPILQGLTRRTVAVSTVANSSNLILPMQAGDLFLLVDRANQLELDEQDIDWIRAQDPGRTQTSANPLVWAMGDRAYPVAKQPSDSSQLYAKSGSALDNVQTIYIEVVTSAGYQRVNSIVMNGTTAVALGPADSVEVEDWYMSSTAGFSDITLHEDSGAGTELARIGIGQVRARHIQVELWPIPSAVLTLYADIRLRVTDMVNIMDEPLIDDEYCEAIVFGAVAREWLKREKPANAAQAKADAKPIIAQLHKKAHKKSGASGDGGGTSRWSQLGPYYPVGS